jgi:hypothetical protein
MKKRLFGLGLIALFLTGGLVFIGCNDGDNKGGNTGGNTGGNSSHQCNSWTACSPQSDPENSCGKSGCYDSSKGDGCAC